jgi:predicted PurR-regulated permease PerM
MEHEDFMQKSMIALIVLVAIIVIFIIATFVILNNAAMKVKKAVDPVIQLTDQAKEFVNEHKDEIKAAYNTAKDKVQTKLQELKPQLKEIGQKVSNLAEQGTEDVLNKINLKLDQWNAQLNAGRR